jgi:hypothetical protein
MKKILYHILVFIAQIITSFIILPVGVIILFLIGLTAVFYERSIGFCELCREIFIDFPREMYQGMRECHYNIEKP